MSINNQTISKITAILICIMPILYSYESLVITVLELGILALYIGFQLAQSAFKISKTPLIIYLCYAMFITLIFGITFYWNSTTTNRSIATIIYISCCIAVSRDEEMYIIKIVYKYIAIFCVAFMIFQIILYEVLNRAIMFQIPFLQLKDGLTQAYKYLGLASSYGITFPRFPGPFSEPSHYAAFTLPLISFYLFGCEKICQKNIVIAVIIAATVLLSTSGLGIVLIACLFVVYAFISSKNAFIVPLLLCIFTIVAFLVYIYVPNVQDIVGNLFIAGSNSSGISKSDYRIYRGFSFFNQLPFINKIFGVGLYNGEKAASNYQISTIYDNNEAAFEYFNGVSQLLIYTGVIGTIIFVSYLFRDIKLNGTLNRKALFIVYLALIFGTASLFEGFGLLYLSLILVMDLKKESQNNTEL